MDTMSPDQIVEEFGDQWRRSDLATKMPLPETSLRQNPAKKLTAVDCDQ